MGLCADPLSDVFSLKKRVGAGVALWVQLQSNFCGYVAFSGNCIVRMEYVWGLR